MFATIKKVVDQSGWNIVEEEIVLDYGSTLIEALDKRDEINDWDFGPLARKMMKEKYDI